jgi:hypothetical protein
VRFESGQPNPNCEQPNAEAAEVTQKPQRDHEELSGVFFCGFCEVFAASAFGCSRLIEET